MQRKVLGAALALMVALAPGAPALAYDTIPYTPQALAAEQASGKPFVIDFYADWCVTCHAQHKVIEQLLESNPAYRSIPIVQVDWDAEEHGPLVKAMAIPRRSTLVVMKGTTELARIVAGTGRQQIASLLDLAL